MVIALPLLGKVLSRQRKFLRGFKYSLSSIIACKGIAHTVKQLSIPKIMVRYLVSLHVLLGKLSYCSIWHFNLSQELLLSPA